MNVYASNKLESNIHFS